MANMVFLNEASTDTAEIIISGTIGYSSWWFWDKPDDKNKNTKDLMRQELDRLKALKAKTILVKIDSLGGNAAHALSIHDSLKDHPAKIITRINGTCASAATIIAMAGDERQMSKNALYLIHKCKGYLFGNENDLVAELDAQRSFNQRMLDIYVSGTGKEKEEIETLMNADNGNGKWIDATEAKDFGFITDIYNEGSQLVASVATQEDFKRFGLPIPNGFAFAQQEETAPTWLAQFKNYVTQLLSNNQKPNTMGKFKSVFPLLCLALAYNDDKEYAEKAGATLSHEELLNLEAKYAALEADKVKAEQEKAAVQAALDTATQQVTDITAARDVLQARIDNTPAPPAPPAGPDGKPDGDTDTFEAWQKKDPYYQTVTKDFL